MAQVGLNKIVGSYQFSQLDLIATGASSAVYRASRVIPQAISDPSSSWTSSHPHATNRAVVKVIPIQTLGSTMNQGHKINWQVNAELKALKVVKHQNIIKLLDSYQTRRNYYLIMEMCEEGSLADCIAQNGRLNDTSIIPIAYQIAKAMHCLFSHSFIHRDIKPQNVLLTKNNSQELVAKLADFGFSIRPQSLPFCDRRSVGSCYYMSPQVHSAQEYSNASDIWAFGVLLYECTQGFMPWPGPFSSQAHLKAAIKRGLPNGGYFPFFTALQPIIIGCMDAAPSNRLNSDQIIAQIGQLASGSPYTLNVASQDEPEQNRCHEKGSRDTIIMKTQYSNIQNQLMKSTFKAFQH